MHELIHEVFGISDTDIQAAFPGLTVDPNNTGNITAWLTQHCVNGKGNY